MTEKQKKLIYTLREMFQFDQADLDFGIYRIMALKRDEVNAFLETELPKHINSELSKLVNTSKDSEIKELDKQIEDMKKSTLSDTIKASAIAELEEKKQSLTSSVDISSLEIGIYSHLHNFFSRYYEEGDFISQRRYKDGAYSIPYEGEEVKLHWANADQYYVKTSEYFKDYIFTVGTSKVHFKLIDAESEKDNNKSDKKRFFQLYNEKPFEIINNELFIYMEYKAGDGNQKKYIEDIVSSFENDDCAKTEFACLLDMKDGKTVLEKKLTHYTAKNSFDYFIHKDLSKFLSRELDNFIKNDVIFLDDIDIEDTEKTKAYLTQAKVIRNIGSKLIQFLAQIEDFQKKLFLKKKFVTESNYCITLDNISKDFYDEIIANDAQREEWIKLFAIDEIVGDLHTKAYSNPLTKDFLEQNEFLVLDTKFFSNDFKEKLIASIDNIDEKTNGLLINSENFQALNLLQEKYKEQVKCIYIDPPYNTGGDGFIYKDNYQHSSWLSMMNDRLVHARNNLPDDGVIFISIDDNEVHNLRTLCDKVFEVNNFVADFLWKKKGTTTNVEGVSVSSLTEHILCYKNSGAGINNRVVSKETRSYPFSDNIGKYRKSGIEKKNEGAYERKTMQFPIIGHKPRNGKRWQIGEEKAKELEKMNRFIFEEGIVKLKIYDFEDKDTTSAYPNLLFENGSTDSATKELKSLIHTIVFDNPKPKELIKQLLIFSDDIKKTMINFDFFAGSGTTGHAVINLNREDGGDRKYILVEMGEYFDTVTKPRIQKVIYSDAWKDGKPTTRVGSSHIMKYLKLESYEDTLNNIVFDELDVPTMLQEEHMLNYMLDIESKNSDSLLPIEKLENPFDYKLKIVQQQESVEQNIDLVETFNYLIGLNVEQSYAIETYDAEFTEGANGAVTATIKSGDTYKLKLIEGATRKGEQTLVIWREMTDDVVKDNAVLDAFFEKQKISIRDFEFDKIYVNCDNNLENIRKDSETWKVTLIEEEFKKLMFEGA